jgi:hypothetical protein
VVPPRTWAILRTRALGYRYEVDMEKMMDGNVFNRWESPVLELQCPNRGLSYQNSAGKRDNM